MKIIVGLGNPEKKYKKTRHNAGFMVVDEFANGKEWEFKKKFNAELCEYSKDILLVKPQTFMNRSGEAVSNLLNFYKKLRTTNYELRTNLWVIHDDIDLPFGTLRIKRGGGTAGHNGLKSLVQHLGTEDFVRFRFGIGRSDVIPLEKYVLMPFSKDEQETVSVGIKKIVKAIQLSLKHGLEKSMNEFN